MILINKITPNTTILTPNRRLAAYHLKQYQQYQLSLEKKCWPTLDILPINSWVERLWQDFTNKTMTAGPLVLSANQELILWEEIISAAAEGSLLQISATAELAKSAWGLLQQWKIDLKNPALSTTEDSHTFLMWAQQFQKQCQKKNCIDQHSLLNVICNKLRAKEITVPAHLIMVGFTDISPLLQEILDLCQSMGTHVEYYLQEKKNNCVQRISLSDMEKEIHTMAEWAKKQLTAHRPSNPTSHLPNSTSRSHDLIGGAGRGAQWR